MFFSFEVIKILVLITVAIILCVAFVNGWTDAPNSVAVCVATKVLPLKKAVRIAAVSDFVGSLTVGMLSGRVCEKIIILTDLECNNKVLTVSVFSAMLSVIIWAVSAWYFGIPTSESHAMLAGLFGSSVAVNNRFDNININEWIKTFSGLIISIIIGFISGYIFLKIFTCFCENYNSEKFKNYQIISSVLTSFMHGAQDSQKFVGLIISVLSISPEISSSGYLHFAMTILCSLLISFGIVSGGERIINTVGKDMVKLDCLSGLSADISGLLCLFISTLSGIPISTTHIKTASILGVGIKNNNINIKTTIKLFLVWLLTFPACGILSYLIASVIIN